MKESIALSAWELITRFHSLKKLNFFPSLLGILWLFCILLYQLTFTYVYIFQKKDEALEALANFAHTEYFSEVLIGLGCLFLLYMVLEPIATGGIIQMIDSYKKSNGERWHRSFQGFFDGLRHFLPIFEVHNITGIFRPLSIITFYILLLRLFGLSYAVSISITMGIYLIFAFFINMCFAYSKFFIIFEGKSALESLGASTGLAIRHIGITGQLYFTMILLYLRTIIIACIFFVIPFAVSSIIAFFTIIAVKYFFVILFLIISIVLLIFIAHLNSTLEIFIEATWYEAYMLCKKEDAEEYGHHDNHSHDDYHRHTEVAHESHATHHDNHWNHH